jgi:hypothetical protein
MMGLDKSRTIKEAKYEAIDPKEAADKQVHLSTQQQADLLNVFEQTETLFDGKLKKYPHHKLHLSLEENAQPYCTRPYRSHIEKYSKEN